MQVDWAGNTLDIYDPVTGDISKTYLFVAVLPCSCYAYAEACNDMKLENWLLCHAHAYSYFGGVTRLLIPDNLKTGVSKIPGMKQFSTGVTRNWPNITILQLSQPEWSTLRTSLWRRAQ